MLVPEFLCGFFWIFYIYDNVFYEQKHLYFFLPDYIPFISFSPHIALSGTSNTTWRRSSKKEHFCFVPDLSGRTSRFSSLSRILAEDTCRYCLSGWENFLFLDFWEFFSRIRCIFSNDFTASMWLYLFSLLIWMDYTDWFSNVKPASLFVINPICSWYIIIFIYFGVHLLIFCWKFLCLHSWKLWVCSFLSL